MDSMIEKYLHDINNAVVKQNIPRIRSLLLELFTFLASPLGRNTLNCSDVQYNLLLDDDFEKEYCRLPSAYVDILRDITSGGLHDTVGSPKIAIMLDSTPEHYLEKIRKLPE
jgi:hypothetical protein